jgi:ribosome assembly protein RRB1
VSSLLSSLEGTPSESVVVGSDLRPAFTFKGHLDEGFSMDWSLTCPGRLLSGDCRKNIHLWEPLEASWNVDRTAFKGHEGSVEDLQWSPTERDVFASCSSDKSIRIWDSRTKAGNILAALNAHDSDVNVISWNRVAAHLLVSGSDDCSFKIWDLRVFKSGEAAGNFKWHSQPITSVSWHPTQESVVSVASDDDSITVWDMSLEADENEKLDIPPQLLFLHRGQKEIKEVHFHQQVPGLILSTASDGFNIFRPDNM